MSAPDTNCVYGFKRDNLLPCPNMLPLENDLDMEYERYYCAVCGKREKLCYEDMA